LKFPDKRLTDNPNQMIIITRVWGLGYVKRNYIKFLSNSAKHNKNGYSNLSARKIGRDSSSSPPLAAQFRSLKIRHVQIRNY